MLFSKLSKTFPHSAHLKCHLLQRADPETRMWVQVVYLEGDTGKHCQGSGEVRQLREGKQKKVRYWQVIAVGKWGLIPPEIPRIYHKMYLKLNPIEWWKSWRVYPSTHWLYAVGGRAVNSLIFQMLQALAGTLWEPEKPSGKELQVLAVESSLIGMHRNGECPKDKGRSPTVCAAG